MRKRGQQCRLSVFGYIEIKSGQQPRSNWVTDICNLPKDVILLTLFDQWTAIDVQRSK